MLFNSLEFAIFFPTVFFVYWFLLKYSFRAQNFFVLICSYLFYGWWDWRFLSLIIGSSIVDFIVGRRLFVTPESRNRKLLLLISLIVNLGLLATFKYYNFFVESFSALLLSIGITPNIRLLSVVLPVGISFYTFQTLSYTIDIYRKQLEPTRDPIAFFAFVAFFPQLVAGPIERAKNLLPQFNKARQFNPQQASIGMRLVLWGLVKKIVIADRLAIVVDTVFSSPEQFSSVELSVAVVAFAFQIYCDFSGYSDIARGIAKLLGFELMVNFRAPYFSKSIQEFWRRWHISLSTWFRDYVYIPLGGNRGSLTQWYFNLWLTFVVSGFWHGANWTFLIWGALHGSYQIVEKGARSLNLSVSRNSSLMSALIDRVGSRIAIFLIVCLAWIYFRADTVSDANFIIGEILSFHLGFQKLLHEVGINTLAVSFLVVCLLLIVDFFVYREKLMEDILKSRFARWVVYLTGVLLLIILGRFTETNFIYFQF